MVVLRLTSQITRAIYQNPELVGTAPLDMNLCVYIVFDLTAKVPGTGLFRRQCLIENPFAPGIAVPDRCVTRTQEEAPKTIVMPSGGLSVSVMRNGNEQYSFCTASSLRA